MPERFVFSSAVEKFVVVFRVEDELMFAEIRNFPTEKDLWEAEILFNPELTKYMIMIITRDDSTFDPNKVTKEQSLIILQQVRNMYFK